MIPKEAYPWLAAVVVLALFFAGLGKVAMILSAIEEPKGEDE